MRSMLEPELLGRGAVGVNTDSSEHTAACRQSLIMAHQVGGSCLSDLPSRQFSSPCQGLYSLDGAIHNIFKMQCRDG